MAKALVDILEDMKDAALRRQEAPVVDIGVDLESGPDGSWRRRHPDTEPAGGRQHTRDRARARERPGNPTYDPHGPLRTGLLDMRAHDGSIVGSPLARGGMIGKV